MSSKPIVFVLGAGASGCYGFPLGKNLCELLTEHLTSGGPAFHHLKNHTSFTTQDIESFRKALLYSGQNSVDAFLENRQEFLDVGKAAMAATLITYESEGALWGFSENNWMRYLYAQMRSPTIEAWSENKVSFVTFNFDRSLDHFLFTSLQNTHKANDEACANALAATPIIHLHGQLGMLSWQKGKKYRPYASEVTALGLEICIDSIKVVHEELQDGRDKDFERAKEKMAIAERIYLLGFGFGGLNIQRLALDQLPENRAIATGYGLTEHEKNAIARILNARVSIYPKHDISSLFRNVVQWN